MVSDYRWLTLYSRGCSREKFCAAKIAIGASRLSLALVWAPQRKINTPVYNASVQLLRYNRAHLPSGEPKERGGLPIAEPGANRGWLRGGRHELFPARGTPLCIERLGWVTDYAIDGIHSPEKVTGRLDEEDVAPSRRASRICWRINARRSSKHLVRRGGRTIFGGNRSGGRK